MKKTFWGLSLALIQALAFAPQASATCAIFCDATLSDEDCNATNEFETDDTINAAGSCEVTCCAPPSPEYPNGDCSSDIVPLEASMLGVLDADFQPVEVMFLETDFLCGENVLLSSDRGLDAGHYYLQSDFDILGEFDVVADTGGSCSSTGGGSATPLALASLLLLGLIRRRREE